MLVTLLISRRRRARRSCSATCAVLFGAAAGRQRRSSAAPDARARTSWPRTVVAMVAGKSLAAVCLAIPLGLLGGRWLLQIATRLVAVSPSRAGQPTAAPLGAVVHCRCVVRGTRGGARRRRRGRRDVGSPGDRRGPDARYILMSTVDMNHADPVIDVEDTFVLHEVGHTRSQR